LWLLRVVFHADDRLDYIFEFLHRKQLGLRLLRVVFHAYLCLE
jgi:hypothetical protein